MVTSQCYTTPSAKEIAMDIHTIQYLFVLVPVIAAAWYLRGMMK